MMRLIPLLMVLLSACSLTGKIDRDDPMTVAFLQKHLTVIAGPEMEGRNTPSAGLDKAANYIEDRFKQWKLEPAAGSYRQWYPIHKDSTTKAMLTVNNISAEYGTDFIINARDNRSAELAAPVVFAGYAVQDEGYNDLDKVNVAGKIVMFALGEPKANDIFLASGKKESAWIINGLSKKLKLLQSKGAKAVIILNPAATSFAQNIISQSRVSNFYYPDTTKNYDLPAVQVNRDFAIKAFGSGMEVLYSKASSAAPFEPADYKTLSENTRVSFAKEVVVVKVSNVLGVVTGSDKKDETVYLTAHYDHLGIRDGKIYYGADDDGSGTVAIMAMAKKMADARKAGKGPRRTVVFMAVSGEEKGLWGSKYYADNPVLPLDKASICLNIDMIGRIDTDRKTADSANYLYVIGSDKRSTELPIAVNKNNLQPSPLVLDLKFDDPKDPFRIFFRSDHYNFAKKGVPALFFYDGMLKADYHRPTDTVDKIEWELYKKRMQYIDNILNDIANREETLKRDLPIPAMTR